MKQRQLGTNGPTVSAIGLSCMSTNYGEPADRPAGITLIRSAVELRVNFFDTAEFYGPFTNEDLVGEALQPVRCTVVISTKFGFAYEPLAHNGTISSASSTTSRNQVGSPTRSSGATQGTTARRAGNVVGRSLRRLHYSRKNDHHH